MKYMIAISICILFIVASYNYPDWIPGKLSHSDELNNDAATGDGPPLNWEIIFNSPTVVSNKLFVDAFKTLNDAQSAVGNNALRDYQSVLEKVLHIAKHYSETDLVVRLLSGEPVLSGKSLQQIEMRISTLSALPDEVLQRLDRSSKGHFSLTGTMITDDVLEHLQNVQITALRLDDSLVTDAGLCHLQNTAGITHLSLRGTQVTDISLAYVSSLTHLVTLDIRNTRITDAGLEHLKDLAGLRALTVSDTQVTDAGLLHLKTLPKCRIFTQTASASAR